MYKACPFELGLNKFAFDPVGVIFFKKCQNVSVWSDRCKLFWDGLDPTLVTYLEMIFLLFRKVTCVQSERFCHILVIFYWNLKRFQFNQTNNRKKENNNCLNDLNEMKLCEGSWNCIINRRRKFQLSILKSKIVLFL